MIPFGLSSLMTVSMPIARRATKCLVPGASAVYLFNEGTGATLRDFSGNAYDGTLGAGAAAPTWTAEGLGFDGGDYVNIGAPAALDIGDGDLSLIVAFASAEAVPTNTNVLSATGGSTYSRADYYIGTRASPSTCFRFGINPDGTYKEVSAGTYSQNTPVCIAGVAAAGALSLYINGAKVASPGTATAASTREYKAVSIGRADSYSVGFRGTVYAAAIYPFAISAAQVAQNYAAFQAILVARRIALP